LSNKQTFMATNIMYSLQGFHIYYGMYMVTKRLEILLLFFFIYIGFPNTLRRLRGDNLKEKIPTIKTKFHS
jgi:hypothetical protein